MPWETAGSYGTRAGTARRRGGDRPASMPSPGRPSPFAAQRWGTVGLAMAWMLVDPLLAFVLYRRVFRKIQLSPRAYLAALWPALSGTALMAAAVLAVGVLSPSGWTPGLRLAAQIGVGVITYGLACVVLHRERFEAFRELVMAARRGTEGRRGTSAGCS